MTVKRKELMIYVIFLLVSMVCLIHAIHIHTEAVISTEETTVALLPVILAVVGLVYGGLAVIIARSMWKYDVGKIFSFKLFLISLAIIIGSYDVEVNDFLVATLFTLSNFFLFALIGKVTELFYSKSFRMVMMTHWLLSLIPLLLVELRKILLYNYLMTFVLIMLFFKLNYKKTSFYTKNQIKSLTKSLSVGMLLYMVLSFGLSIEINTEVEGSHEGLIVIVEGAIGTNGGDAFVISTIPAIFFAFVTFRVFNYLVEREYFKEVDVFSIKKMMREILYFSLFNLLLVLSVTTNMLIIYFLNVCLWIPFIFHALEKNQNEVQRYKDVQLLEDEKYRFAIYLHDEILQDIFTLKYMLPLDEKAEENVTALIQKVRNVSHDLYPLVVENFGLSRSLQLYLDEINENEKWEIDYAYDYPLGALPVYIETSVYRMVKELTANIIKHAVCKQIRVHLYQEDHDLMIKVVDDGKGFDVPDLSTFVLKKSMGLSSVYRQVNRMKGEFQLQSRKDNGTTCLIKIPIEDEG